MKPEVEVNIVTGMEPEIHYSVPPWIVKLIRAAFWIDKKIKKIRGMK